MTASQIVQSLLAMDHSSRMRFMRRLKQTDANLFLEIRKELNKLNIAIGN